MRYQWCGCKGECKLINSNNKSLNNFGEKTVNIQLLKQFAYEKLLTSSILRDILLSEKQHLPVSEFLVKTEIWLKLIESEETKWNHIKSSEK